VQKIEGGHFTDNKGVAAGFTPAHYAPVKGAATDNVGFPRQALTALHRSAATRKRRESSQFKTRCT
jgi:hypothetical protein